MVSESRNRGIVENGTAVLHHRNGGSESPGILRCKGYDTFGPFKLVGGIAKGHPDEEDMKNAVDFVKGLH